MFEKYTTEILLKFLDRKCKEAEKEIEEKGTLSEDKAMPILLRTQFNHIAHLDVELTQLRELMGKNFKIAQTSRENILQIMDQRFKIAETDRNEKFKIAETERENLRKRIDKKFNLIFTAITIGFTIIGFLIVLFSFLK